jgi:diguanylate cyclase (GGDEF)-like protein
VSVGGLWVLCRALADPGWRPAVRHLVLLGLDPALILVLAIAEPWLHLVASDVQVAPDGQLPWISWAPGPAFWVHGPIVVGITLWSVGRLVRALPHGGPLQRRQAVALLAALLIPATPSLIAVTSTRSGTVPDLVVLSNIVTGLVALYVLDRQGLLRLVPVARGLVLDRLSDAVIVVGPDDRLLDTNAAAEGLLRALDPRLPRRLAGLAVAGLPAMFANVLTAAAERGVDQAHRAELPDGPAVLDLRVEPLTDGHGRAMARVVVVRDVTVLHEQREALAAVNERLREQLATVDQLRENLAEQAVRDELTGLHNRRHLVARLEQEVAAALRDDTELCLVLLDIDHFKSVNDEHGHAVGDRLLVATARALGAVVRRHDTIARYGGEEFVVLLPRTTVEQAVLRAEEWRELCRRVHAPSPSGTISRTISAGLAGLRTHIGPHGTPALLLQAADEALYAAKAGGRDRVVVAGTGMGTNRPFRRPLTRFTTR